MIFEELAGLQYGLFALGCYSASMFFCALGSFLIWYFSKEKTYLFLSLFILLMGLLTPFAPGSSGPDFSTKETIIQFQIFASLSILTNHVLYKFLEHHYKLKETQNLLAKFLRLPIYFGWAALPFLLTVHSPFFYSVMTINLMLFTMLSIFLFVKETQKDLNNFWMAFGNIFFQITAVIYITENLHHLFSNLIYLILFGGFIQALFFIIASVIRYENSRTEVQRLSKAALLGEISSGIAHEIRNPLSIASAKLQMAQEVTPDSSEIKKHTQFAENKINQALAIITRIQKFGSANGVDQIQFSTVFLIDLIKDALELCDIKIRYNSITVKNNFSEKLNLRCPPNDIIQVLANLISNSCDAIKNLENKWIEIETLETEKWIIIKITDSGLGIAKELRNKIFNSFFTTKANEGTGLGLSISKKIITDLGGELYINNNFPHTQFVIELPKI